jgi:MFS superfamily sulfate permease-like transporter
MVDIAGLSRIGHINKNEIYIAVITLTGVLLFGILAGVLIGAFLSLIEILYRVSFPHMAVLGRIPDSDTFGDISRHPENEVVEGIFIFRIDAPLIFANAESVKETMLNAIGQQQRQIHVVIVDLESSPFTDVTAVDMIRDLITELEHKGIELRIANASGQMRDILRRAGIEEKVGRLDQATTIAAIIRQSRDSQGE